MSDFPGYEDGFALVNELIAEVAAVVDLRGTLDDGHWARVVLRSLFALLEGFISRFKGRALQAQRYGNVTFSPKLLRILEEGEAVTRDDGTVEWEQVRPRTSDNLRVAVRAYATTLNTGTPLGGEARLPTEFTIALKARNRVTHPKTPSDLIVTAEELRAAAKILTWFMTISAWSSREETRNINELERKLHIDTEALRAKIQSYGGNSDNTESSKSRHLTVEEMYTAPRLTKE